VNGHGVILIIDDDVDYACLVRVAVQEACIPHPVEMLHDGHAAVNYLQQFGAMSSGNGATLPALVLLDLKLPHFSGLEVLRWIRSRPELTPVPVILFSGIEPGDERSQALALGAASFEVKTFSYRELLEQIAHIRDGFLQPQEFGQAA